IAVSVAVAFAEAPHEARESVTRRRRPWPTANILEAQAAFASGIRQGLDATMVAETVPVKRHRSDAGRLGPLGEQLAHRRRGGQVPAVLELGIHRAGGSERPPLKIVDDLGINMV